METNDFKRILNDDNIFFSLLKKTKSKMIHESLKDYMSYITQPLIHGNYKTYIILSFPISIIYTLINSISTILVVHAAFIGVYLLLAMLDWISGIISSIYKKKEKFNSARFLKKPLLIGFCLTIVFIIEKLIISFTNYENENGGAVIESILSVIVFGFHIIKIVMMLSFIIYELTSIRENFLTLGLDDFVSYIDIVIVPLKKINTYLEKKFDTTVENNNNGIQP